MTEVDIFGNEVLVSPIISRERLTAALIPLLKDITAERLAAMLVDPVAELFEYALLCNGAKTCKRTSLMFNQHRLSTVCGKGRCPVDAMADESYISGIARAGLSQVAGNPAAIRNLIYRALEMGANAVQLANEFPPHVARDAVRRFANHADAQVLDPCAGWGGRMLGVSAAGAGYTAFEPSTRTHDGLSMLRDWIDQLSPGFANKCWVLRQPFEDGQLPAEHFDFAITSPPYFDTERYSDEDTNSLNRWPTFPQWCDGFYLPLIDKTMAALKPGATFMLNIGSRKYPLNQVMLDHCAGRFRVTKGGGLSGKGGLGKTGEGEVFYYISKE